MDLLVSLPGAVFSFIHFYYFLAAISEDEDVAGLNIGNRIFHYFSLIENCNPHYSCLYYKDDERVSH